jgi:hypothetical protein
LQAHKRKSLVPLPDENAPGWAGREERRYWCPDIHAQHSVLLQIGRLAEICGCMSGKDCASDTLTGDPVVGEETGAHERWNDLA